MNQSATYKPPGSELTELSIIGKCLNGELLEVLPNISDHHFLRPNHAKAYRIIYDQYLKYGKISESVLEDDSNFANLFSQGNLTYAKNVAETEQTSLLIDKLKDSYRKNLLYKAAYRVLEQTQDVEAGAGDITAFLTNELKEINHDTDLQTLNLDEIAESLKSGELGRRLNIGNDLDRFYQKTGSHYGTTEVALAHSKHGKTRYACYRALQYIKQGYKGLYVTCEGLNSDIWEVMHQMGYDPDGKMLEVSDSAKEINDICNLIWQAKSRHNIDFVILDYFQRVRVKGIKSSDYVQRISEASMQFTDTVKRENVFGLGLAQPKNIENTRKGWHMFPNVDDVYGGGQIKKDAYIVTGLFRPAKSKEITWKNEITGQFAVSDHEGNLTHEDSVFLKQLVTRKGKTNMDIIQFIDSEQGMQIASETYDKNGNWKQLGY